MIPVQSDGYEYPSTFAADTLHNALKAEGTRIATADFSFIWDTGIAAPVNKFIMYVYNASDAELTLVHSWGATQVLQPGTWTRYEPACSQGHLDGWTSGIGNGSQMGLNDEGEYQMQFPVNMVNVAGGSNYTLYIAGCYL